MGSIVEIVIGNLLLIFYSKKEIDNAKKLVTKLNCSDISTLYGNMEVSTKMIS